MTRLPRLDLDASVLLLPKRRFHAQGGGYPENSKQQGE